MGAPVWGFVWKAIIGTAISYATSAITNKLFGPKAQNNSPTYAFGRLQTQTNSGMVMPLPYGRVKCAGNVIWASDPGTVQHKIISFGVGKIKGFSEVKLNDISVYTQNFLSVKNILYTDSRVGIGALGMLSVASVHLFGGGVGTKYIPLNGNMQDICSAINAYSAQGWVATTDTPSKSALEIKIPSHVTFVNCYYSPFFLCHENLPGCSYTPYMGDGEQLIDNRVTGTAQEDKAKLVGGLKYDAYLAITATASEKLTGDYNTTAIVEGRIVKIYTSPTSYYEDWSDNPAWCFLDFMTSVDGCGMSVNENDIQTLLNASRYYDELVNGKKRFTFNMIMDEKKSRQDWLDEILITCRSYRTYQRGLHGILVDKPELVSQVFKVKPDESIETWWQDNAEDVERLQIEYIDPGYEYTKVVAQADRVQLQGETSQFRNKSPLTKKISIYGINNFEQASREAWFHLNKAQTCPEWIQYTTNKRALNRSIGDVVGIWNPITEVVEPGLAYKRYRIISMTEPQENRITMVMQEYNPNLYGDTMGSVAPVINITTLPNAMAPPPDVYNLYAEEYFREQGNGIVLTDLIVNFNPPDYMFYSHAEVYIKSSQPTSNEIDIPWDQMDNVTFSNIGDAVNKWTYVNKAIDNIVLQNLSKGNEYSIKIVAVNKMNLKSTFDTAPVLKHLIRGKTYTPSTPTGLTVNITDRCLWHWNPLNSDCDFAELRTDRNMGNVSGLLAKTSSTQAVVMPPVRHGVVYLYAHNTAGYYSDPAILEYNKVAPLAPSGIVYTKVFQGVTVTMDSLPLYCQGINVHANDGTGDAVLFSPNNAYTMKTTGGIFEMSVAYVDIFGEGQKSPIVEVVIKAMIDPALLAAESLSLDKMDKVVKDAVAKAQVAVDTTIFSNVTDTLVKADASNATAIQQTNSNITQAVTNFNGQISQVQQTASGLATTVQSNKADADGKLSTVGSQINQQADRITSVVTGLNSANTAIAQTEAALQLRATAANLISLINMCPEAITILSKLVHISGDTLFDDNVIVNKMLSALCITANKIAAGAITAEKISATLAEIKGKLTASQIDAGVISADKITTGILKADLIYQAGYQVRCNVMVKGAISHGATIPLPAGYTADQCCWGSMGGVANSAVISDDNSTPHTPDMISINPNRLVSASVSFAYDFNGSSYQNYTAYGSIYYWIMGVK